MPGQTKRDIRELRKERTIKAEEQDAVAAQKKAEALDKRQRTDGATDKLMLQNQYLTSFQDEGINVDSRMSNPEGLELYANTADEAEMISRLRENVPPDRLPESMQATLDARGLRVAEPGSKADQLNKKRLADGGKGATQTAYEIVRLDDGTTYITSNLVLQDADGNPVKESVRVAFPVMTKDNVPKDLREPTSFVRVSPQGAKHVSVTYDPNAEAAKRRGTRLGEQGSAAGTMFDWRTMQQAKQSDSARLNADLADVDLENAPANQLTYEGEPFVYDKPVAGAEEATNEDNKRSFQRKAAESSATRQQNQLDDMDEQVRANQEFDDWEAEGADADTTETSEQLMARQARQQSEVNEGLADVKRKQAAQDLPKARGSSPGNRIRNLSVALPTAGIALLAGSGMAPEGMTAYAEESTPEDINTAQQLAALGAGGTDALSRAERIRRLRGGRSRRLGPAAFGTYQNISP